MATDYEDLRATCPNSRDALSAKLDALAAALFPRIRGCRSRAGMADHHATAQLSRVYVVDVDGVDVRVETEVEWRGAGQLLFTVELVGWLPYLSFDAFCSHVEERLLEKRQKQVSAQR